MAEETNPYLSPVYPDEGERGLLPERDWSALRIRVVQAEKYALRRRIFLAGDVQAEIYYNGWVPNELVTVNARKMFRGGITYLSIVSPVIPFEVETASHRVPALIEAKATFSFTTLFRLRRFAIHVGGQLVYADNG